MFLSLFLFYYKIVRTLSSLGQTETKGGKKMINEYFDLKTMTKNFSLDQTKENSVESEESHEDLDNRKITCSQCKKMIFGKF